MRAPEDRQGRSGQVTAPRFHRAVAVAGRESAQEGQCQWRLATGGNRERGSSADRYSVLVLNQSVMVSWCLSACPLEMLWIGFFAEGEVGVYGIRNGEVSFGRPVETS